MKSVNEYTKNIKRIEFSVTYACNSRCRHCLVIHRNTEMQIEKERAARLVTEMAKQYDIKSVMTFGGEPLLYPDTVEAIHRAAAQAGIPKRQLITNGGIWDETAKLEQQADMIFSCEINQVLLSVDTFHMEFIPLIRQHTFARLLQEKGFEGLSLNPVWVASPEDDNVFNRETRECMKTFSDLDIPIGRGNVIRPEGNAQKYLERFYKKGAFRQDFQCGDTPYTERLDSPSTISVEPDGNVTVCTFPIGNIYEMDIEQILEEYDPHKNPMMAALLSGGISSLQQYMESIGFQVNLSDYYTPCQFCSEMQSLQRQ